MQDKLVLSPLPKTWILDIDGTIVKHNGYKIDGIDSFLDGAEEFLKSIPEEDFIIFVTSRVEEYAEITESFLRNNGIRFNSIIYGVPYGERILINDNKPSGLKMAYSISGTRDSFPNLNICIDESI